VRRCRCFSRLDLPLLPLSLVAINKDGSDKVLFVVALTYLLLVLFLSLLLLLLLLLSLFTLTPILLFILALYLFVFFSTAFTVAHVGGDS